MENVDQSHETNGTKWDQTVINQQVCEKLGIEPIWTDCVCGGNPADCARFQPGRVLYPELATEAGFFILWAALKRNGWSTCAVDDGQDCWAKLDRPGVEVRSGYYDTPQQALLMAAAAALGVQE